ncbi:unnamed protein product [Clonostachys rhizophaga]|uniref:F-box domain-containing protein n=1 Tax=Clonostachys rhizophaga TaxID=160324 RepID=A0A9N9YH00_9HYPO|nr:unnamed protein product [Clonostachys rhizophaga]
MPNSASSQALALPEILTPILTLVDDDDDGCGTLAAAARVNTVWFGCATGLLWKKISGAALGCVPAHRRQVYASKIEAIVFTAEDRDLHEPFRELEFVLLRELTLHTYHPSPGNGALYNLRQYCRPRLDKFYFYGGELDREFMSYLQNTCRDLTRLWIDLPGPKVTVDSFFDFVSGFRSLEEIHLKRGIDHLLSDKILYHLARQPNLRELDIGHYLSPRLLSDISQKIPGAFPALGSLGATVVSDCVPKIIHILKHVTCLDLRILDNELDALTTLGSTLRLQKIKILYDCRSQLTKSQFLALKALQNLENLAIRSTVDAIEVSDPSGSLLCDEDFQELVSGMSNLRSLELETIADLGIDSLLALSASCPMMEELELLTAFDLQKLLTKAGDEPIFPHLRRLEISGMPNRIFKSMDDLVMTATNVFTQMEHHFPELETLYLGKDDPLADIITAMFYESDDESDDYENDYEDDYDDDESEAREDDILEN